MWPIRGKRAGAARIKEALDNLPAGVCFFDSAGMPVLCNRRMYQLTRIMSGCDLQHLSELERMLRLPAAAVRVLEKERVFLLPDGAVWQFDQTRIQDEAGVAYTQASAYDMTELYHVQEELRVDTEKQRQMAQRLTALRRNVLTLAREEETLNVKMRIHDDVGRGVLATRRLLEQGLTTDKLDMSLWRMAVSVLRSDSAPREKAEPMAELQGAAAALGVTLHIEGELPENEADAYVLIAAMRECMTNCVRHAGGADVYARIDCRGSETCARITNNGALPPGDISEGGGLSSLRRRVERRGGTMRVDSVPAFALRIALPAKGDEL